MIKDLKDTLILLGYPMRKLYYLTPTNKKEFVVKPKSKEV